MLTRVGIAVAFIVPGFAFAAFDDVTLTTDTVLSVNGITLNVTGSSAAVESITVNAANFSVTLPLGSSFQVTAPGLERLSADTSSGLASDVCNASQSLVKYAPTESAVTVTITPSATLCSSAGSGGSGSSSSVTTTSSSSSSSSSSSTVATPTTPQTTEETPVTTTTTTESTEHANASGLSNAQIQSILDVLASFNADASVIAQVTASLKGVTTGSVTSAAVHVFKDNLTTGSTLGSEVKALQQFLNAHGYTVSTTGAGSAGNETTKFGAATKAALIKYQKAKGITPASGYFGPKTRASVNSEK